MAVDNNFNVKVPLDPTTPPGSNQVVIWKPESGSFQLTGSYGAGSTGVTATDGTTTVPNATTLNFVNGDVANAGSGQANVSFDLQGVTDNGFLTSNNSMFLWSTTANYANQTNINASSGFRKDGLNAKTHVTPQKSSERQTLLAVIANSNNDPLPYDQNYIVYGGVTSNPGTTSTSGGGETDPPTVCTNKFNNSTLTGPLDITTVSTGNTITLIGNVISNSDVVLAVNDEVIIYTVESPLNYIVATVTFVPTVPTSNYSFSVTTVNWDGSSTNPGNGFCLYAVDKKSLTLTVGGENALGQLALSQTGSTSDNTRSGMLLTSTGNIHFFKNDAKLSSSGSFEIVSASAKISYTPYDNAINFSIGDTSPSSPPKTMLYVSKSGDDARVGIGTEKPASTFEIKTKQGSSKEAPDFILSVPSGSVVEGAESSRLAFVIEDTQFSGSKLLVSGSTGAIYSRVLGEQSAFQYGSLVLEVDGPNLSERDYKAIEIGHGLFTNDSNNIGIAVSSSIEMGGFTNPRIFIKNASNENIIKIGNDTTAPPDTNAGELRIFDNNTEKIVFRTYANADSYINTTGNFGVGTTSPEAKLEVVGDTILSGSLAVSQSFTASGLYYPDTDGTDGQVLTTDGLGNLSFQTIEDVYVTVKNVSGGTLAKGTPVHATSSVSAGNATPVIAASASDASTMPATFVLNEQIADEAEGQALLSGFIQGVNTSLFEVGEVVYVGENGGFTNVKPTGSNNLIQNLGIVTKIHASNGSGWIYGSGRSNDVPNLPTGKIWVGSDSYTVTSSVISLDETNKYVSGSESAKFKLDTYAFGYNTFPGFGFDITGSGIIVSSSLPSEHYPMVKIGETELLDLSTATALSDHTFTIHNVDNFQVTSGSEPTEISTNKLFEHTGNAFNVYTNGDTTKVIDASATSIKFGATDLYLAPSSTTYVKATSTSIPQYIAGWDTLPTTPGVGAALTYVTSSTFTGGGGGGNVSNTGTPLDNQVAVWTDATTIEGTTKLTFSSNSLKVLATNTDGAYVEIYGGTPFSSDYPYISAGGLYNILYFGDSSSGNIFEFRNNKLSFAGDATNTYIQANTDVPEDLEIHADQDIILAADNAVVIGAVTDVEARISSYRTQVVSNGFYSQADLRYLTFNTTGETTTFNYLSLMPAPANGKLISISVWPQASGGSTVMGLHINSNATPSSTDTQTLTAGVPVTFTFSSGNTFSQNDELSFSIDPTGTPNGLFFSIILEYDY